MNNQTHSINKLKLAGSIIVVLIAFFLSTIIMRSCQFAHPKANIKPLPEEQTKQLNDILNQKYPDRLAVIKPSPFISDAKSIKLLSKSAVVVNVANGSILYEKNPDEVIPPASLLKLVQMYIVMKEIHSGTVHLEDVVPLSESSWASSMPPNSSLMFLGKNQTVTLQELMLGLSIASGNDASYAIANFISGNMQAFIERMNLEMSNLGLTKSNFVESSGYSENNLTTAKEMATIIRSYIVNYPETLKLFHNQKIFTYPQKHNLAPEDVGKTREQDFTHGIPQNIYTPITQKNTNPLLGLIEGVDGIKTGYIDESGYNLAMTIERGDMRILAIMMGGPGNSLSEGNATRIADSKAIIDYIYRNYTDFGNLTAYKNYRVPVIKSKLRQITLIPAYPPQTLTVTNQMWPMMQMEVKTPYMLSKNIEAGSAYGSIDYYYVDNESGERVIVTSVPLVSNVSSKKAFWWIRAADTFAKGFVK